MGGYPAGTRFECPGCKKMLSYSAIKRHEEIEDCSDPDSWPKPKRRPGKHQDAISKLTRTTFGSVEMVLWEEKRRWTLPEDAMPFISNPDYGKSTKRWEGDGVGFTEKATIELWCAGEIDWLKRFLNGFESRTDIKVVMDFLGWSNRNSENWKDAYINLQNDYPLERFIDVKRGSGHGGENSQFAVSEEEHARRIELLDSLPDNCGYDGIKAVLGNSARRRIFCWVQGNYPEVDRLIPDIPLSTLSISQIRHTLMKAFNERGWARRTITKNCCEPECSEKTDRWYRCKEHAEAYIQAAYDKVGGE